MNLRAVLSIVATSLSTFSYAQVPTPAEMKVEIAKRKALEILNKAIEKSNDSTLSNMAGRLKSARLFEGFYAPRNYCSGHSALFYVLPSHRQYIFFCESTVPFHGEEYLAESLIHESAHLAGYRDECQATHMQVYAMKSAGLESLLMQEPNFTYRNCRVP
jgi:hypothetical protein